MTGKNRTLSANTMSSPAKAISATIVSVAGLTWSYHLLASGLVNQLSFISLVAIWMLVFLFISFSHRIKVLSFRQLSIELERIEEARKEIEARGERIRRIAHIISEITLFFAAFQHRSLGEGDSETQRAWHETKVRELLKTTEATPEERSTVFRLFDAVKQMDAQRDTLPPDERERRWEEIHRQVANEINRA
jgi:hypothetical protein